MKNDNLFDKVKVKTGRLVRIWNKDRKTKNEKPLYVSVWVEDFDGSNERCLLFTEHQIKVAEERAKKNLEDLTNKDFLTDIFD